MLRVWVFGFSVEIFFAELGRHISGLPTIKMKVQGCKKCALFLEVGHQCMVSLFWVGFTEYRIM